MVHWFWLGWIVGVNTILIMVCAHLAIKTILSDKKTRKQRTDLKDISYFDGESKIKDVTITSDVSVGKTYSKEWHDNTKMLPANPIYFERLSITNPTPLSFGNVLSPSLPFILPQGGFITSLIFIVTSAEVLSDNDLGNILSNSSFELQKFNGERKTLHPMQIIRNSGKSFCFSLINPPGGFDLKNAITTYDVLVSLEWNYKGNIKFNARYETEMICT